MNEAIVDSPIGHIMIKEENDAIVFLSLVNDDLKASDYPLINRAIQEINEYFLNKRKAFSFPIRLEGTSFQKSVWKALLSIPYGETRSYEDIARMINNPKSVRAVGHAIHNNPLMIIVPCHRVINKNGKLGGFAFGLETKTFLLDLEKEKSFLN